MSMKFQIGDIVRFVKLRGPRMVVISVVSAGSPIPNGLGGHMPSPRTTYGVAWFDRNDNLQERAAIQEQWLDKVEEADNQPTRLGIVEFPGRPFPSFSEDDNDPNIDKT